jgi:hypothetical protein
VQLHESLFLPGVDKFFIQVKSTKRTRCGKTTKPEMRKHIENHPSISIGLDTSTYPHRPKEKKKIKNVKFKEKIRATKTLQLSRILPPTHSSDKRERTDTGERKVLLHR